MGPARPGFGHEQPAILRQPGQQHAGKISCGGLPAGGDVAHGRTIGAGLAPGTTRGNCMRRLAVTLATLAAMSAAHAAEPVKIGITTILSTPIADRGQSEQYGAQTRAGPDQRSRRRAGPPGGGVTTPTTPATRKWACPPARRLLEQEHVPVVIGALCTPVTHAIMPVMAEAKVPLIIATSAGQDFVDASGVGGNAYAWKTIPSEVDIARGLLGYLATQGVEKMAILADDNGFSRANAIGFGRVAGELGIEVVTTIDRAAQDGRFRTLGGRVARHGAGPGAERAGSVHGRNRQGARRLRLGRAAHRAAGLLGPRRAAAGAAGAVRRAWPCSAPRCPPCRRSSAATAPIPGSRRRSAPSSSTKPSSSPWTRSAAPARTRPRRSRRPSRPRQMPSLLGGTYAMDDHNHPHTPLLILGLRDGKPAVIATE